MSSCKLVICVCVEPDFISLQTDSFKRFLKQSVDFCIVDDSRTSELSQKIRDACTMLGHEYLRSPDHAPHRTDASCRHADTLLYGWKNMRRVNSAGEKYKYIGTFDSDLFPVTPLDLDEILAEEDILCVKLISTHMYFFWPGCCIWRTNAHKLEDYEWDICLDQGVRGDTGGSTYFYWRDNPVKALELSMYQFAHMPRSEWAEHLMKLPRPILEFCLQDIPVADSLRIRWWSDLFVDPRSRFIFFHVRDISNWQGINQEYLSSKCRHFIEACRLNISS